LQTNLSTAHKYVVCFSKSSSLQIISSDHQWIPPPKWPVLCRVGR